MEPMSVLKIIVAMFAGYGFLAVLSLFSEQVRAWKVYLDELHKQERLPRPIPPPPKPQPMEIAHGTHPPDADIALSREVLLSELKLSSMFLSPEERIAREEQARAERTRT